MECFSYFLLSSRSSYSVCSPSRAEGEKEKRIRRSRAQVPPQTRNGARHLRRREVLEPSYRLRPDRRSPATNTARERRRGRL